MFFSAAVSMEDWTGMFGTWAKPGVWKILTTMKEAGVTRVYWRSLGSGQAPRPSKVTESATFWTTGRTVPRHELLDPETAKVLGIELRELVSDFGAFDHQECARDLASKLDLEFYLWHEVHGESHSGQYSSFILEHPELRAINRWGEAMTGNLSWGYPEAIERRLKLLEESLSYQPDGIAIDLVKSGDHIFPRVDQHGYSAIGYETPIVKAFKEKTGKDPHEVPNTDEEWVRFRASYVTEFIRKARALQKRTAPNCKFGVFASPKGRLFPAYLNDEPFTRVPRRPGTRSSLYDFEDDPRWISVGFPGGLEGNLEDLDAWLNEDLLDYVDAGIVNVPARVEEGETEDMDPYRAVIEHEKARVGGRAPFGTVLESWMRTRDHLVEGSRVAKEAGCEEVVLFESQGIERNNRWDAVRESVDKYGD